MNISLFLGTIPQDLLVTEKEMTKINKGGKGIKVTAIVTMKDTKSTNNGILMLKNMEKKMYVIITDIDTVITTGDRINEIFFLPKPT